MLAKLKANFLANSDRLFPPLDENEHTYDDLYHDISDIGETEGIAIKQLWHHVQSLYQNDSEKLLEEFEVLYYTIEILF